MHWCMDETLAFLAMIPFIGYFFAKLHTWWHTKFHHKCHEEGCESDHVEHTHDHPNDVKISAGDTLIICGWDSIHQDDVEARFGGCAIDDLIGDDWLLDVEERPADDEFRWFVDSKQGLRAVFQERIFAYEDGFLGCEWYELSSDEINKELKGKC